MTQFITLAGRKQVGKDSSAEIIKALLVYDSFSFYLKEGEIELGGATINDQGRAMMNKVHIVHFADALKKACNIIFGIPLEDMETEGGKQKLTKVRWPIPIYDDDLVDFVTGFTPNPQGEFMTVREVLQFVGTDLFRNQMDPDTWLNSIFMQPWIEDDIVIIADARFPNEVTLGRKNGLLIRIERSTGLVDDGHKSENALDHYSDYHHTVDNNQSVDHLVEQLTAIIKTEGMFV